MKKILGLFILTIFIVTSCVKQKFENDLFGYWTVEDYIYGGVDQMSPDLNVQLEFTNIDNGEGDMSMIYYFLGTQISDIGTFVLNEDYSQMEITFGNIGNTIWKVDLTMVNSTLILNGYTETNQGGVLSSTAVYIKANK